VQTFRPRREVDAGSVVVGVALVAVVLLVTYAADWPEGTRDMIRWLLEVGR
jgi:hypothetical protein